MGLLIAAVIVLFLVCLLVAADRAVKAVRRGRLRREAGLRLAAAAAEAEARDKQRKAAERVSGALTSVMPTIHDIETRRVNEPGSVPPRPAAPATAAPGPAAQPPAAQPPAAQEPTAQAPAAPGPTTP